MPRDGVSRNGRPASLRGSAVFRYVNTQFNSFYLDLCPSQIYLALAFLKLEEAIARRRPPILSSTCHEGLSGGSISCKLAECRL